MTNLRTVLITTVIVLLQVTVKSHRVRLVEDREFPFVVSLNHAGLKIPVCLGSLVTSRQAVTSCHCVSNPPLYLHESSRVVIVNPRDYIVVAGSAVFHDVSREIQREIRKIKVHPYCSSSEEGRSWNVAVVKMASSFPFNNFIQPFYPYAENPRDVADKLAMFVSTEECELISWEKTRVLANGSIIYPRRLVAYTLILLQGSHCVHDENSDPGVLCGWAGHTNGRFCSFAFGGPLICRRAVYAIHVGGSSCGELGDYTILTRLENVQAFIDKYTRRKTSILFSSAVKLTHWKLYISCVLLLPEYWISR